MPHPDEKQFESYLRRFRPLSPLPIETSARPRRFALLAASLAVLAMVLLVVGFRLYLRPAGKNSGERTAIAPAEIVGSASPLTVGSANALLAAAPSFRTVIEQMSFGTAMWRPTEGKSSALGILSKEKTRL